MALMDIISNAATGGLLGSVGGIASKFIEGKHAIKLKELDNDLQTKLSAHEIALTKLQFESQRTIAEIDAGKEIAVADAALQSASYGNDTAAYASVDVSRSHWSMLLVDAIRGLVRPLLTTVLVVFNVVIAFWLWDKNGATMDGKDSYSLLKTMVDNLALCTSLAISWYFGARAHRAEGN